MQFYIFSFSPTYLDSQMPSRSTNSKFEDSNSFSLSSASNEKLSIADLRCPDPSISFSLVTDSPGFHDSSYLPKRFKSRWWLHFMNVNSIVHLSAASIFIYSWLEFPLFSFTGRREIKLSKHFFKLRNF